ncbi:MAG: hypothetical protein ACOYD4_15195, partial [Solirubrobacterales bacterium]
MGAWAIVLVILAMKIPIFGLIWLVWWAGRAPAEEGPADAVRSQLTPRRPEPPLPLRPRRRGPHGGAAGLTRPASPGRRPRPQPTAAGR